MPDKLGMYAYYDTPDGQDGAKKAFFLAKWGGILGGTLCGWKIIQQHTPTTMPAILGKMATWSFPAACMGAGYAAATYFACQQRQKDDPYNHMFGGIAAGTILGGRVKSVKYGCLWMAIFGFGAMAYKWGRMEGLGFIPQKYIDDEMAKNRHRGTPFQWYSKFNEPFLTKAEKK